MVSRSGFNGFTMCCKSYRGEEKKKQESRSGLDCVQSWFFERKGKERQEPTLKVQNYQSRLVLDIFILNLFPILFPARVSAGPSKGPHLRRPGFRLVRLPSLTCLIF